MQQLKKNKKTLSFRFFPPIPKKKEEKKSLFLWKSTLKTPAAPPLQPLLSSADLAQPVVRLGVSYDGLNGDDGLVDLRLQLPQLFDVQQPQDLGCFVQGSICWEEQEYRY